MSSDMTWLAISDRASVAILPNADTLDQATQDAEAWVVSQYKGIQPPKTEYTYVALNQVDQSTVDGIMNRTISPHDILIQTKKDRRVVEVIVHPRTPPCKAGHKSHTWTCLTDLAEKHILHKQDGIIDDTENSVHQCGICGLIRHDTMIYPVVDHPPRLVVQYDITQHNAPPTYSDKDLAELV